MQTKLMAILNVTPDSFFDKGKFYHIDQAIDRGIQMYEEGADIIDIGGESTRPYAEAVSVEEELARVIPVIAALKAKIPVPISIDTMKWQVAKEALAAGANLINDVTGFQNPEMVQIAAASQAKICVMHMKGKPKNMQDNPTYEAGVLPEIIDFFNTQVAFLLSQGVEKEQIILDPGIGFGKSIDDNLQIIHNLQEVKRIGFPLLLGISRKSFMGKITGKPADSLLPATLGFNTVAIMSGVDMIRVHDVKEHRMLIDLMQKYKEI